MTTQDKPRALVTGGSGYFGLVVVQKLLEAGYSVRVLDLVDVPDRDPRVDFVQGDIRDAKVVREACDGVQVVHHNVAQVPLAKDRHLFESVNVDGARILFEACEAKGVGKVINVSSSAVFGVPEENPVTEAMVPHPLEDYGRAKRNAEWIAHRFVTQGLDITTIRPRTILGHGRLGIFQILFELVRRGRPLYVLRGGHNRYQFVHASDLADACVLAGKLSGPNLFHIGASQFGTIRQMLQALVKHAGTQSAIRSLPMRPATALMDLTSALGLSPLGPYHSLMYGREMFFDISRAETALGWRARFSNEQMICESYDYYVQNRHEILTRVGASHHRSPVQQGILRLLMIAP